MIPAMISSILMAYRIGQARGVGYLAAARVGGKRVKNALKIALSARIAYNGRMNDVGARLEALCRSHAISILYAFGSRAEEARDLVQGSRDRLSPTVSDLDLGVRPVGTTPLHVKEKAILAAELEDLFDAPRVDLVLLPEADPFLAATIIRGERLYAADSIEADEYDLYVLRRAGDLAPLERERLDLLEGK